MIDSGQLLASNLSYVCHSMLRVSILLIYIYMILYFCGEQKPTGQLLASKTSIVCHSVYSSSIFKKCILFCCGQGMLSQNSCNIL